MPPRARSTVTAFLLAATACAGGARADDAKALQEGAPALAQYRQPVDKTVNKALAFLARIQVKQRDAASNRYARGLAGGFPTRVSPGAVTSLCGMAFLSKGYTPGHEPYGDVIDGTIDFVVTQVDANGYAGGTGQHSGGGMYAHSICTLFLSEVSGMVDPARQRKIDTALPKMVRILIAAHQVRKYGPHQGGWRYRPNSNDSDLSLTGWALMALRSARLNGVPVPGEMIEDTVKYILRCRNATSGGFNYQPGHSLGTHNMTGVGLLCLELVGQHRTPATKKAGDYLLQTIRAGRFLDARWFYYGVYYGSQGMFQLGDDYWVPWAQRMYQELIKKQNSDGSWGNQVGRAQRGQPQWQSYMHTQTAYETAMCVLALTVPYRQLPIYQRDEPLDGRRK